MGIEKYFGFGSAIRYPLDTADDWWRKTDHWSLITDDGWSLITGDWWLITGDWWLRIDAADAVNADTAASDKNNTADADADTADTDEHEQMCRWAD